MISVNVSTNLETVEAADREAVIGNVLELARVVERKAEELAMSASITVFVDQ